MNIGSAPIFPSSTRERRKHRVIGLAAILILIVATLAVFFLRDAQRKRTEANYLQARKVIAAIASGDRAFCKEPLEHSLSAVRKELGRAPVQTRLINHRALVYHRMLVVARERCAGSMAGPTIESNEEPCREAEECFHRACFWTIEGNFDRALGYAKEGIVLDESPAGRELATLIEQVGEEAGLDD